MFEHSLRKRQPSEEVQLAGPFHILARKTAIVRLALAQRRIGEQRLVIMLPDREETDPLQKSGRQGKPDAAEPPIGQEDDRRWRAQHDKKKIYRSREDLEKYFSRSEEHKSELQSLMRISYAGFCLTKNVMTRHIQGLHALLVSHVFSTRKNTH